MFPDRYVFGVLTSALLIGCALFSAIPRNALAAPTTTATATPTATATATASPTPTATATATPTPATKLANISTRARVESGDNVLIAGFIVTGTKDKKVIIRGLGPSLSLPGPLADPTLELRTSNGTILDSNDDWTSKPDGSAQRTEIEATGIAPSNDLESAMLKTLPANGASYTAILKGRNGGTGIGVVEIYDLDAAADPELANISTRGVVSTGDKVLIAGTIIEGQGNKVLRVMIRAIGPSLSIAGKLRDPSLELRGENGGLIEANDNWGDSLDKQAIIDSGIAPSDPLESAIIATLPGGNSKYTAIVRGVVEVGSPSVSRIHFGSGNTVEVQRIQFPRTPTGGSFQLIVTRPTSIVSGQPGDRAALQDSITIPWNATADDLKAAIMASSNFYKYDQNNHLTAGPAGFHTLFDSGGGLGTAGNEGSRREPVVTGSVTDFTIQFGTLTTGSVGTRNTWITGLPLVQIDDSEIIYGDSRLGVVEVYALH
jgi:hypothetical protein